MLFVVVCSIHIQDVGSDGLVTFCDPGLFWGRDWWWGHLSLAFIIVPYVMLWVLAAPIAVKEMCKRECRKWVACVAWLLVGLPATVVLDLVMLLRFPFHTPRSGALLNMMRLRVVLEACLEAPSQTTLQVRIFFYRVMHRGAELQVPWTLLFSICTSLVSMGLIVKEIWETAESQDISVFEAIKDLLLVGLGRRAPLLHVLRTQRNVDFRDEGALTASTWSRSRRSSLATSWPASSSMPTRMTSRVPTSRISSRSCAQQTRSRWWGCSRSRAQSTGAPRPTSS